MTGEQLGKLFIIYAAQRAPTPMAAGETYALLYGDDDYLIDHERCELRFPDLTEPVGFEKSDDGDETLPMWLARVVQPNGESEIIAGNCLPFSDEAKELLPCNGKGEVRAMPYLVWKQMQDPTVRARVAAKRGPTDKAWYRGMKQGK
jgi:hypothetical protein